METGNKHIKSNYLLKDSSLDGSRIKQCHTFFNLRENGIGVLICDHTRKNILAIGDCQWQPQLDPQQIVESLEQFFLAADFNFDDCLSTRWFLSQKKSSLVPLELFEEKSERSILKLSSNITQKEIISSDIWAKQHIVCCYSMTSTLLEWLKFNFAQSEIHHSSRALFNIYNHYPQHGAFAYLHVEDENIELLLCNEGRLLLYNMFEYKVNEDLLYYLLFAFEQSRILAPEVHLKISGIPLKDSGLITLLKEYIGEVDMVTLPKAFSCSENISPEKIQRVFNLLGGL